MRTRRKVVLMALLGAALAVGLAYAQPAGPWTRDREPQPPALPRVRAPGFVGGPLAGLLADPASHVEVALTDDGVELIIATEPERVEELRERAHRAAGALERVAARLEERGLEEGRLMPRGGPGLLGVAARGEMRVEVRDIDDGVVLSLTSDKPEVVERLHERMPQMVEAARERAEQRREWAERAGRPERRGAALGLLAHDEVDVQVRETDEGVVIRVTSEDPELAHSIREELPGAIERLQEFGERRREWREPEQPWRRGMMPGPRWGRGHVPEPMVPHGCGPLLGRRYGAPYGPGAMRRGGWGPGWHRMRGFGPGRGFGHEPGPWEHHEW